METLQANHSGRGMSLNLEGIGRVDFAGWVFPRPLILSPLSAGDLGNLDEARFPNGVDCIL